jgi:hypothetical protein
VRRATRHRAIRPEPQQTPIGQNDDAFGKVELVIQVGQKPTDYRLAGLELFGDPAPPVGGQALAVFAGSFQSGSSTRLEVTFGQGSTGDPSARALQ